VRTVYWIILYDGSYSCCEENRDRVLEIFLAQRCQCLAQITFIQGSRCRGPGAQIELLDDNKYSVERQEHVYYYYYYYLGKRVAGESEIVSVYIIYLGERPH
jgi:hypothetical protein